jgi:hypothetical protein
MSAPPTAGICHHEFDFIDITKISVHNFSPLLSANSVYHKKIQIATLQVPKGISTKRG